MAPDKYAFWFEGKPWKGAPERGIKEGDLRDGGSLEQRASTVAGYTLSNNRGPSSIENTSFGRRWITGSPVRWRTTGRNS
jgi:hypothetical protein